MRLGHQLRGLAAYREGRAAGRADRRGAGQRRLTEAGGQRGQARRRRRGDVGRRHDRREWWSAEYPAGQPADWPARGRDRGDDDRAPGVRPGSAAADGTRGIGAGGRFGRRWKKALARRAIMCGIEARRRMTARVRTGSGSTAEADGAGRLRRRHATASLGNGAPGRARTAAGPRCCTARFRRICRRIRDICSTSTSSSTPARHASARPPSNRARSDRRRSPCG